MSAGIYALVGVVVGGLLTIGGQAGLTWWQAKRAGEAEWKVVSRLVADDLERLMRDLADLILDEKVPRKVRDDGLSSSLWDEHRAAVARGLADDPSGDEFWRGLSRIYANARELRWMLGVWTPGTEFTDWQLKLMRVDLAMAARAYESLTGVLPEVSRRPGFDAMLARSQEDVTPRVTPRPAGEG